MHRKMNATALATLSEWFLFNVNDQRYLLNYLSLKLQIDDPVNGFLKIVAFGADIIQKRFSKVDKVLQGLGFATALIGIGLIFQLWNTRKLDLFKTTVYKYKFTGCYTFELRYHV